MSRKNSTVAAVAIPPIRHNANNVPNTNIVLLIIHTQLYNNIHNEFEREREKKRGGQGHDPIGLHCLNTRPCANAYNEPAQHPPLYSCTLTNHNGTLHTYSYAYQRTRTVHIRLIQPTVIYN